MHLPVDAELPHAGIGFEIFEDGNEGFVTADNFKVFINVEMCHPCVLLPEETMTFIIQKKLVIVFMVLLRSIVDESNVLAGNRIIVGG